MMNSGIAARKAAACVSFAVLAAAGSLANAAAFVIDDRADDPAPIGVFANDFERGMFINGNLFQQGLNNPASGFAPGESFNFEGSWIDNGQTPSGVRTIYFVEEGTFDVVSDILQYQTTSNGGFGHIVGSFTSDGDPGSLGTVPVGTSTADVWLEGAGDFHFDLPFLTGVVQTTPAPGSIFMLALGGAFATRRRRA